MSRQEITGTSVPDLVVDTLAAARVARPPEAFFSTLQIWAVLVVGVLASLVLALQPIVLGSLAEEGRLTLREMGQTAMLESLGMAAAVALSGLILRPRKLKLIVAAAALVSVLASIVAVIASHESLQLARLVNGLTVGVVLWVWTGLLTNIALPARYVAIFVALQSAGGLALSWLLSTFVLSRWGGSGAYAILAFLSFLNLFLALCVPPQYPSQPKASGQRIQLPSPRGFVGLIAVLMQLAGVMGLWVYVLPLGQQMGLATSFVTSSVSVALGAQIAGGLCGAMCARMNAKVALYFSVAASLVGLALIASNGGAISFLVGLAIIAFFLMFAPGFQMPYLLEVDPGRGAGMQMITAQQLGFSVGPVLTSLMIRDGDVSSAPAVSAVLFLGSSVLVFATTMIRRR